jgi:hypothetical protein
MVTLANGLVNGEKAKTDCGDFDVASITHSY